MPERVEAEISEASRVPCRLGHNRIVHPTSDASPQAFPLSPVTGADWTRLGRRRQPGGPAAAGRRAGRGPDRRGHQGLVRDAAVVEGSGAAGTKPERVRTLDSHPTLYSHAKPAVRWERHTSPTDRAAIDLPISPCRAAPAPPRVNR